MRWPFGSNVHLTLKSLSTVLLVLRQVHARWLAPPGAPPPHSSLHVHIRPRGAVVQRLAAQRWVGSGAQFGTSLRSRKLLQSWAAAAGSTQADISLDELLGVNR